MQARVRQAKRDDAATGRAARRPRSEPGSTLTPDLYARGRAAYLAHGTISAVREATGLSVPASARLIDSGEPRLDLPSLRECARAAAAEVDRRASKVEGKAASEQAAGLAKVLEARVVAAKEARAVETAAIGDAVRSRNDEVRLVRANRQSALVLAGVNADLLRVAGRLGQSLLADVEGLTKLAPEKRLSLLRTIAGIVHRTAQSSAASVSMEQLLMGKPTAIIGHVGDSGGPSADMTPEEAEQWFKLAERAWQRRARRRTPIDSTAEVLGQGGPSKDDDEDDLLEDL